MPCYHPIPALQDGLGADVRLWPPVGTANLELPCGTCLGCRADRALQWARRAQHEATEWKHNCFLTLTYNDERLPPNGALNQTHLQKFIKRLRRARDRHSDALLTGPTGNLRYLAAGEYGEKTQRPHFHLLLFNCDFSDTYRVGKDLRESHLLKQLWPDGQHRLGTLTGASAHYVAGYTLKNIGKTYCTPDGELLPSPFIRASLKPAIGQNWINKNKEDLKHGYLITDGKKGRVPQAYKKMLAKGELSDRQLGESLSQRAALAARRPPQGRTKAEERQAQERIHLQKTRLRNVEVTLHGL